MIGAVLAGCGGAYRNYPRWTIDEGTTTRTDCVEAQAFVRVSGKTGVGVAVQLKSHGDCAVRVTRAELVIGAQRHAAEVPQVTTLAGRSLVYVWLPFAFDNNRAWNDGLRSGQFELQLEANGHAGAPWIIPTNHEFVGGRWRDLGVR